jgi:hypothetical protein
MALNVNGEQQLLQQILNIVGQACQAAAQIRA